MTLIGVPNCEPFGVSGHLLTVHVIILLHVKSRFLVFTLCGETAMA